MTNATVTIPRQAGYYVTAAASELASPAESWAQTGALKSWKVSMSSRLALMAFVVLGASGAWQRNGGSSRRDMPWSISAACISSSLSRRPMLQRVKRRPRAASEIGPFLPLIADIIGALGWSAIRSKTQ
jgi:hypothetical protein